MLCDEEDRSQFRPEANEQDERLGVQRGQRRQREGEAAVTDSGRARRSVSVSIYTPTSRVRFFFPLFF